MMARIIDMKRRVIAVCLVLMLCSLLPAEEKKDALVLYRNGEYEESATVCQQEIKENPSNIDSYVVLCWALVANRQYSEASYWSVKGREVLKYDPRLVEVQAESEYYLGKNDESLAHFQEYISLIGSSGSRIGDAYYFMGEIYIREEKYNHADISFSQAVRMEPLRDFWWSRLGYAREMAGENLSAINAYEKALTLNPSQEAAKAGKLRVTQLMQ